MTPTRYYFNLKWQLIFGISLIFLGGVFVYTMLAMMSDSFHFPLFFFNLFYMNIVFLNTFFFMRSLISPVLQIFDTEVVLSLPLRKVIPKKDVDFLLIKGKYAEISFTHQGRKYFDRFKVRSHAFKDFSLKGDSFSKALGSGSH